jgi:hypothetical protein
MSEVSRPFWMFRTGFVTHPAADIAVKPPSLSYSCIEAIPGGRALDLLQPLYPTLAAHGAVFE